MTKKELIEEIEFAGNYEKVRIDARGDVTGVPVGEPSRYQSATNTGGRRYIGYDTEILSALVDCGQVSSEEAETYKFRVSVAIKY